MKAMKAVSDRTLDMFPFWLQDERALSEDLLGLTMHSGPEPVSVDPPSFGFFYIQTDPEKERGGVRMALPLEIAERDPDAVVSFVADAVADLPLAYGFAGYSLSWDPNGYRMLERAETWAVPLLKRHPGLGLGDLLPYVFHAHHGVLAVNWLTLLGTQYTDVLGGFPVIARSLGGEYALVSLGNGGTLIRAGDIPLLGDVNRANRLQHYQKVGRALRPVWVPDDIVENINILIMRGEDKIKWINRFS
jgi:hypothetical protein